MNMKSHKIYLIISGITLALIGASLTFFPIAFKKSLDMDLTGQTNVLNDYGAFGMLVVAIGIFSIVASQKKKLLRNATVTITTFFIALFIGRLIGILLQGVPVDGLLMAGAFEVGLGIVGVWIYLSYNAND